MRANNSQNVWIKEGNEYNYDLPEEVILQLKMADKQRTIGRMLQERISKYPETMTESDWAQWAICRPFMVGKGAFMRK